MKILSFNIRGLGGAPKKLALKRLLLNLKPNILLIQEIMCSGESARETFRQWLKNWSFCTIDVNGMSGGLLSGWSQDFQALTLFSVCSSILVKLKHKNNDLAFSVVNIYGLYSDRAPFWEELSSACVFANPLLVVGGDSNFTLSLREVWGVNPRED
jgi:exonuclease III